MKKWVQMTQVTEELRERVDRLERVFCVSTVIFKRFTPIFCSLFKNPFLSEEGSSGSGMCGTQPPKGTPQSPSKRSPGKFKRTCSPNDLFHFSWILFIQVSHKVISSHLFGTLAGVIIFCPSYMSYLK